jgi:hypothetical protein
MYISLEFCEKYQDIDFLTLAMGNGVDTQEGLSVWDIFNRRIKDPSGIYKVGKYYIDKDKVTALTDSVLFNALPLKGFEQEVLALINLRGRDYRQALEGLWSRIIDNNLLKLPKIDFEQRIKNARARDRDKNKKPCKAGGQAGLKSKILSQPLGYLESYPYYIRNSV